MIDQLRTKLARDNGVQVEPENVLITAGASQAIDLVCAALLNPGDTIISEEPTWMGAVRMFRAHEAGIVGVPMDEQGMKMDALEEKLEGAEGRRASSQSSSTPSPPSRTPRA